MISIIGKGRMATIGNRIAHTAMNTSINGSNSPPSSSPIMNIVSNLSTAKLTRNPDFPRHTLTSRIHSLYLCSDLPLMDGGSLSNAK